MKIPHGLDRRSFMHCGAAKVRVAMTANQFGHETMGIMLS